jgi:hypothetical protein
VRVSSASVRWYGDVHKFLGVLKNIGINDILLRHLFLFIGATEYDNLTVTRRPNDTTFEVTEEPPGKLFIP